MEWTVSIFYLKQFLIRIFVEEKSAINPYKNGHSFRVNEMIYIKYITGIIAVFRFIRFVFLFHLPLPNVCISHFADNVSCPLQSLAEREKKIQLVSLITWM